jgi:phospholipid/cholesterol/gamma-HCH transport system substrate-binding protein
LFVSQSAGREDRLPRTYRARRTLALALLIAVVALLAVAMFGPGGGGGYQVKARFQNANLLVKGNEVQVAGVAVGSVDGIDLTPDGQAEVTVSIDDGGYAPLRRGTEAIVRQSSLAGVANRYIELRLPPGGSGRPTIPDGGVIDAEHTVSAVDLDQIFNTFDARTRRALSGVIRGSAATIKGRSREARLGLLYLNPSLAASRRLLGEINGDTPSFEKFLVSSSKLVSDVAAERDSLAGLVDNLATTTGAIGRRRRELAQGIGRLPPTLRRANTTFVNLRAALDQLDPLVADAKPVVRKARPFFAQLRPLARGARPTVRDLARLLRGRGRSDDLVDAVRGLPSLRNAATRPVQANGKTRMPALTNLTELLKGVAPQLAYIRPYSVDATGWFDDFAHSGVYDALGGTGRVASHTAAFANVGSVLTFVPTDLRDDVFRQVAQRNQRDRCPGALERGSAYKPSGDNCDLRQVPAGP